MFESARPFTALGSKGLSSSLDDDRLRLHEYTFTTSDGEKYRVEFHEYKNDLFIGKYYPNRLSKERDRFAILLKKDYKFASEVISTVRMIFLEIYQKKTVKAFGFIGEPTVNKFRNRNRKKKKTTYRVTEREYLTQRYRIYLNLSYRDLRTNRFDIFRNDSKSAVLLINLDRVSNVEEYVFIVEEMMRRNYPQFD